MRLQNNLSLISYQEERYHCAVGANCQSACVSTLPDKAKSAVRRVDKLRTQSPLPLWGGEFWVSELPIWGAGPIGQLGER